MATIAVTQTGTAKITIIHLNGHNLSPYTQERKKSNQDQKLCPTVVQMQSQQLLQCPLLYNQQHQCSPLLTINPFLHLIPIEMAPKVFVPLCVVVLAAALAAEPPVADAASAHLHFYMHDVLGASAVQVVRGPRGMFGNTVVMDDVLTEGPAATSSVLGRAQGQYIVASTGSMDLMVTMNVVLSSGPFAGSSVTVVGRDDTGAAVRELTVVGGTGQFRMARGYVLWRTIRPDLLELDVYVNP